MRLLTALAPKEDPLTGTTARSNGDLKDEADMQRHEPTVRLHLWLEMGDEMFLKKTEKILGVKLIEQNGCKKDGRRLTGHGQLLKKKYLLRFHEAERWTLQKVGEIFPWPLRS